MDREIYDRFRRLVYEKSGISLGEGKEALVSSRLLRRMRALSIPDHEDYLRHVLEDRSGEEVVRLIDAISTNVTSFFREPEHFDFLSQLIRDAVESGERRFRLWCAAASTGEEPYSLAMTVMEALGGISANARILATDISTKVLSVCREGRYSGEKVQNVPAALRERYLVAERGRRAAGAVFRVRPVLSQMLVFGRLNLATPPYPMRGPLDVVFCRNVMIYFDNRVRKNLLGEIHRLLKPGGYLMVGHAESLASMLAPFDVVRPSIYRKT